MSHPDDPGRPGEPGVSRSAPDPDAQAPQPDSTGQESVNPYVREATTGGDARPGDDPYSSIQAQPAQSRQEAQAGQEGSTPDQSPWSRPGPETTSEVPPSSAASAQESASGQQPGQSAGGESFRQSYPPAQSYPQAQPYPPQEPQQSYLGQQPYQEQQSFQPPQGAEGQHQWQPVPPQGPGSYPQQGGTPYPPPAAGPAGGTPYPPAGGTPYPPATIPAMPNHPMPYPPRVQQRADYARWGRRVGAFLIDNIPNYIVMIVTLVWYFSFIATMVTAAQRGGDFEPDLSSMTIWMIVIGVLSLASLGWSIYNRWITGGRTGQSLGKRVTKIKLISEQTGQPIGAGYAFLRDLVHYLDGIAYIGFLWPLWDEKRQTFADKLMQTVVVDQPDRTS